MISYFHKIPRSSVSSRSARSRVHQRRCSSRINQSADDPHISEQKEFPLFELDPTHQIKEPPELIEKLSAQLASEGWPVEIRWTEQKGRGVFATRRIKEGEVILKETPFAQATTSPDFCHNCLRNISNEAYTLPSGADIVLDGIEVPAGLAQNPQSQHRRSKACDCRKCREEIYCGTECEQKAWTHHHSTLCVGSEPDVKTSTSLMELKTRALANDERSPFLALRILAMLQRELDDGTIQQVYTHKGSTLQGGSWDKILTLDHKMVPADLIETRAEYQTINQIWGNAFSPKILSPSIYAQIKSIIKKNGTSLDVPTVLLGKAPAHRSDVPYVTRMGAITHGIILPYFGAFFNHSCDSNAALEPVNGGRSLSWVALKEIGYGEEVAVSYVSPDLSAWDKREELLEHWGFWCLCPECESGSENKWGQIPDDLISHSPTEVK